MKKQTSPRPRLYQAQNIMELMGQCHGGMCVDIHDIKDIRAVLARCQDDELVAAAQRDRETFMSIISVAWTAERRQEFYNKYLSRSVAVGLTQDEVKLLGVALNRWISDAEREMSKQSDNTQWEKCNTHVEKLDTLLHKLAHCYAALLHSQTN